MRLGNSGGKNRGKKYLKIRGDEIITPENQVKADSFKQWFGSMYKTLQKELINKDTYDEDVLNDTFLRLYDKVLYGGLVIANYKAYFHRAFFTNFIQNTINKGKLSEKFVELDYETNTKDESEDIKNSLRLEILFSKKILNYIRQKYPTSEFEIFKMYVSAIPKITYSELSVITGLPQDQIGNIISPIKKDILNNKEFTEQRKTM